MTHQGFKAVQSPRQSPREAATAARTAAMVVVTGAGAVRVLLLLVVMVVDTCKEGQ